MSSCINLKAENWISDGTLDFSSSNKECFEYKNNTAQKVSFQYKEPIKINDTDCKKIKIVCECEFNNAGGYIVINDCISVPLNATACVDIAAPVVLNVKLFVQAESYVCVKKLEIEPVLEDANLITELSAEPDILVITPAYPSLCNLYSCAFAHSRNREYHNSGLKVQVASISGGNWYQMSYNHEEVPVFHGDYEALKLLLSKKQYKAIVVHFVDENLYPIFDGYVDNEKLLFICHGPETVFKYLVNVTRPYFSRPVEKYRIDEIFEVKEKYVKKYAAKDNVEWIFVSDWLRDFSEKELGLTFKNSRVINNIINEDLFPYSPKTAEDRRKILIIRKFDNICQHSIDQIVMAILSLSKKEFFKELTFEFYGDGDYYDVLVAPLLQFDNVILHRTFIPNNKISEVYKSFGILLLPSRHDAHAVAMGEGAASGMVVVGSRVTSNPFFMKEEVNHTLADAEDYEELAGIIERLYNNPQEFLDISKRLSEDTHNNYCKKKTVKKEIELIKQKLSEFSEDAALTVTPNLNPVLTIAIPAYNVEAYISKCINSILSAPNIADIEVLVINDGSKDNTAAICERFETLSNGIVKLINKENGGHGSTINTAIGLAKGKYFRLVDGDDWVDSENLAELVEIMKTSSSDIILTKGCYEYVEKAQLEDIIKYDNLIEGKVYNFDDIIYEGYGFNSYGPLLTTGNYKTELLRAAGFKISEKKPYVDMEFNSFSLKCITTLEYHNLDIYRYLIGRAGQTVSRDFWKRKYMDHRFIIFNILNHVVNSNEYSKNKKQYIYKNIIAQMVDSQIFMYDCLCKWSEIDAFLEELKGYGDIYDICIKYIVDKKGNCDLIINQYKEALKNENINEPIVIPGVRERIEDLKSAPLCNQASKNYLKLALKAIMPYGVLKLVRILKNRF